MTHILHEGNIIDVIFDTHREDSIKNAERSNRGCTTGIQFQNMAPGHRIQQWRKFISSSANRVSIIRFLVAEWKPHKLRENLNDQQLYVAKPACTSPMIGGQRLQACSQTKKRLVQECMQLMPQQKSNIRWHQCDGSLPCVLRRCIISLVPEMRNKESG